MNNADDQLTTVLYLDTSALLKRYVVEVGSTWIKQQCNASTGNVLATSIITKAEATAALAAKLRLGGLSLQDHQTAEKELFADFANAYRLVAIDQPLVDLAGALAKRQALRGYDAVQLAAAVTLNDVLVQEQLSPLTFITADDDLLKAASGEGLTTDNPNLHP